MALRDVLAAFRVDVDAKGLDAAEKKIGSALGTLQRFGAYMVAGFAGNAVVDFVKGQVDMADSLNDTANKLGIATEDLERWQFVAQLSGSSAEAMGASLGFLNKALGQAEEGSKEAVGAFKKLGVETKNSDGSARELGDVLPDIVENWNKLESQGEKTTVAMKLFGRAGTGLIPMLNEGGESARALIEEFEKLGGPTPAKFIEMSAEVNDELDKQKRAVHMLSIQVVSGLLPSYKWIVEHATKAINAFRKFAQDTQFVHRMLGILAAGGLTFVLIKLGKIAKEAGSVGKAIKKIFGLGPKELLIIAALAVLYVLFDDLWTLIEGGDSVLGGVLDKMLGVGAATKYVEELKAAWTDIQKTLGDLGIHVDGVGDIFKGLGEIVIMTFAGVVQAIAGTVQAVAGLVKGAIAGAKALWEIAKVDADHKLDVEAFEKQTRALSEAGSTIGAGFENIGKGFAKPVQGVVGAFGGPEAQGAAAMGERLAPGAAGVTGWTMGAPSAAAPAVPGKVDQRNQITNNFYVDPNTIRDSVNGGIGDAVKGMLGDAKAAIGGQP